MLDLGVRIIGEYEKLRNEKSEKQELMEQSSRFFEPKDDVLTGDETVSGATNDDEERILLDTTALAVIRDYNTNVLGISFFQSNRWFKITHAKINPSSDEQKVLNARADKVLQRIRQSNYYSQIVNLESDVMGYGHGLFYIEKNKDTFARCLAMNPYDAFFETDVFGDVYKILWENEYDLTSLKKIFPKAADLELPADPRTTPATVGEGSKYCVVACCEKLDNIVDLTEEEKEKKVEGYKWVIRYVLKDTDKFEGGDKKKKGMLLEESSDYFKSQPVFAVRDNVRYKYGSGTYRDLLPKARILNAIALGQLEMVHNQYDPALEVEAYIQEKQGNKKFLAGTRFIRKKEGMGMDNGKPSVIPLQVVGDLAAVDAIHRKHQEDMVSFLPTAANIYKTARQSIEEIHQRLDQEERKLAPLRANYAKEAVNAHLRRFYHLCEMEGDFDDLGDLPDNMGKWNDPDLIIDGFLLQKAREGELRRISQALTTSAPLGAISPQSLQGYVDGDKTLKGIWDNLEVYKYLKDDQTVQQERQETVALAEREQQRADQEAAVNSAQAGADIAKVLMGGQ